MILGICAEDNLTLIMVNGNTDYGIVNEVLNSLSDIGINPKPFFSVSGFGACMSMLFCIKDSELCATLEVLGRLKDRYSDLYSCVSADITRITMELDRCGPEKIIDALKNQNISIKLMHTSNGSIDIFTPGGNTGRALKILDKLKSNS